ncbi:3-methylcrotonyl-CoA carboxylase alpha subunit [Blastomyces dermatitidis ER-3]|uniref:3-methylcrotonyl-CoA carboxylase alpha subunit n=2 Tax=Ajellomyces dermatitidis TaxID=5039 RepID=F2TEE0_AJEDA|nr:3-methylcrotonyl-CoA carboxylase alpha subunit [Blastomyces dermatitidis ER-3]EEQ89079.2 3-methylcrotonyl-CoA carboxylase alpha subunit [Blastomyces dermatitidis ER-3]EGE81603.2 3-methylcrotonyl-CoA carboxylase alpha subunit [Blastomyces dermatitidis ATCC 18188]EQL31769.1 3-methylcrotonyl-CoA carboxylase alpha subunit [Blastomyces dermatitidis ATCC 26199]
MRTPARMSFISRLPSTTSRLGTRAAILKPTAATVRANSALSNGPEIKALSSILIANRGEIALRVGRTASQHGIRVTTLYTDPDARAQHALSSPFAFNLGDTSAYLDGDRIIEIAKKEGCQGIHPGYGFLSENSAFAQKCTQAGLVFIGPPPKAIEAMGDKSRSKEIMTAAGVPCVPGYHGENQNMDFLEAEAEKIKFPVLIKAVKGGGGKGMRIASSKETFRDQLISAKSEAMNSFGDDTMLVEKYITTPRHIEVQVFADKHGNCVALGERDCSIQRRHQKILEESPAPHLPEATRKDIWDKARSAALAVGYEGAGTVEFIFDNDTGEFFFMEMNTRLQVEHPVTEMVTGQDLVHWQILVAEGAPLPLTQDEIEAIMATKGHAIEARIYAENPDQGFVPDSGRLLHVRTPAASEDVRIDAGFVAGDEVSSHYDPMISKLIVRGANRTEALRNLSMALEEYEVAGPITNIEFLKRVCKSPDFVSGNVETGYIDKHKAELFAKEPVENEVLAQVALSCLLSESKSSGPAGTTVGFSPAYQERQFAFVEATAQNPSSEASGSAAAPFNVQVQQTGAATFNVVVNGTSFQNVKVQHQRQQESNVVTSFFPHTRLDTTVVRDEDTITAFQRGRQYRFKIPRAKWMEKALGIKDTANSVLAPMPCKVLRVEVVEGATVVKDQPLVVIESMKMETVIRSPQDGKIEKVVHKAGDICKAGSALVEFADASSDADTKIS